MAVNFNNTNQTQDQQQQSQQQGQQQQGQQQQQQQQQRQTYQAGNRALPFAPRIGIQGVVGVQNDGEVFNKLFATLEQVCKEANASNPDAVYTPVKLMKDTLDLNYSGIVLAEQVGKNVSAHILMIERTGLYPEPIIENINGARYEIIRTPADALDSKYVTAAQITTAQTLRVDIDDVIVTDGTLVPNEFDINDESAVMGLIGNTFMAVHTENVIRSGYTGINIKDIITNNPGGKFVVNMYFNKQDTQHFDKTTMPIRQDVCVVLTYRMGNNQDRRSVNQGSGSVEIIRTYGYIDFEFSGTPNPQTGLQASQKFVPNFVITGFQSDSSPTTDFLALGIASVISLNEDFRWWQAFTSTPARKGEVDYNDIGALNIEGNIEVSPSGFGKLFDTKDSKFGLMELNTLITSLVRPNMIISIDVPKASPETWYTSVFRWNKLHNSPEATARIVESINTLTNGNFVQPTNIFTDIVNRIHGGFYKDKNGYKDIRHLSCYLGMANHVNATNQSPTMISAYTDTLYNSAVPSEVRASERYKMLQEASGGTMVTKQHYDRLTFTSEALINMVNALRSVGWTPVFSDIQMAGADMFHRRSTLDMSGATLNQDVRVMGQNDLYSGWGGFNQYGYVRNW